MGEVSRKCMFFNCDVCENVHTFHLVHDIYVDLCEGHTNMAVSSHYSTVALIEFLVSLKGNSPEYRAEMRQFVIDEIQKVVDGQ